MTSHRLYVCHHMHFTQRHIHSLWLHTIVVITLYPLYSWHHTPFIWHHRHGNTNIISAIWHPISNTTSTVSVSSNPGHHLHHTHSLYDITHIIRVTSYSVCMLSQKMFMTLYASMYNSSSSIFMTSYPICMLSPYCFYDNTTNLPDISPTIFDITATVSVSSQRWHTHLYWCITLSMTSQQVCKSSHLANIWHHTQICHIIFTLYNINDHALWHHRHFNHDIRSPLYDIKSTL